MLPLRQIWLAGVVTVGLLLPLNSAAEQQDVEDSPYLRSAVAMGEAMLTRQRPDGRFVDPPEISPWQGGALLEDWRLTVHAGVCRALFELYRASGEERFREAGEAGLWHLAAFLQPPPDGSPESRRVTGRLDATAETLLAALEWLQAVPPADPTAALATPRALGRDLVDRLEQQRETPAAAGPFPLPRAAGLATLALARLTAADPLCAAGAPCPWRQGAEDWAGWMMAVRDLGKTLDALPRDAPSLLALDALHAMNPEGHSYFLHARRMGDGIVRRMAGEQTPPPFRTAAERTMALMAAWRISRRSGTTDAEHYRQEATDTAARLLAGNPARLPLSELRLALPALLDRNEAPW